MFIRKETTTFCCLENEIDTSTIKERKEGLPFSRQSCEVLECDMCIPPIKQHPGHSKYTEASGDVV